MKNYKVEIEVSKDEIIQIFACINTFIFAVRSMAPIPGIDIVGNVLVRLLGAVHKKIREEKRMWALRDRTTGLCYCPRCGSGVRSFDLRCPGCKQDIEITRERLSPITVNGDELYSPLMILKSAAGYYLGRKYKNPHSGWIPGTRQTDYIPTFEMAVTALNDYPANRRDCAENEEIYRIEDEGGFD